MSLFLLIYLAAYGGMNAYCCWKVLQAFPMARWQALLVAGVFLLMVLAPLAIQLLDRGGHLRLARALSWLGHNWMAVAVWAFLLLAMADVWNVLVRLAALAAPAVRRAALPHPATVLVVAAIVVVLTAMAITQANSVHLREIVLRSPRLPRSARPIRIAQISDVHLGITTGPSRFSRTIELLREAQPDVIVATGDIFDSSSDTDEMADHARELAALQPPLGKFAVLGNHEFYVGLGRSLEFYKTAGFRVLRGESARVGEHLMICGVDDPAGERLGMKTFTQELTALPSPLDRPAVVVLLKHQPRVLPTSPGQFDVQLSGHTHGGQFFPFSLLVCGIYPYCHGLYPLEAGTPAGAPADRGTVDAGAQSCPLPALYVSRGVGTWGPKMRLLSPPEVAIIRVEPE